MKYLYYILFLILFPIFVYGQRDKKDTLNYVILNLDYTSNSETFGLSTSDIKQPSYILGSSYLLKNGIDITYTAIATDNSDENFTNFTSEHNFGIGYMFDLSKQISIYSNYTHILHGKNSSALKTIYSNIADIDVYFSTKYYSASLITNYLWGQKNMFHLSLSNSLEYNFDKVFSNNDILSVQLGMGINISDLNYYNTTLYKGFSNDEFLFYVRENHTTRYALSILSEINENGFDKVREGYFNKNPQLFKPEYKLTSVDFYVPIYYTLKNLMFSASIFVAVPIATNDFYDQYTSIVFSGGTSYFFQL